MRKSELSIYPASRWDYRRRLSARVFRQALDSLVQFHFEEELVEIEDTEQVEKDDPLMRVVTNKDPYMCRKVIIAVELLHFPRKLSVLDYLHSKKVYYKNPKSGNYDGQRIVVVGGGDSALDGAVMILEQNGHVDQAIREDVPEGKARGRPVDILIIPDGTLMVSDDHAGVIYRISYE